MGTSAHTCHFGLSTSKSINFRESAVSAAMWRPSGNQRGE